MDTDRCRYRGGGSALNQTENKSTESTNKGRGT